MKITLVKKARKEVTCSKCGKPILVGTSYRWWKHAFSRPTRWHVDHGHPRASDLTTSDKLQRLYGAQEAADDAVSDAQTVDYTIDEEASSDDNIKRVKDEMMDKLSELKSVFDESASEAREVADEYREGAENIREHFGDTAQTDDMDSKADAAEEFADNLENVDLEVEPEEPDKDASIEDIMKEFEDWFDGVISEATGATELSI